MLPWVALSCLEKIVLLLRSDENNNAIYICWTNQTDSDMLTLSKCFEFDLLKVQLTSVWVVLSQNMQLNDTTDRNISLNFSTSIKSKFEPNWEKCSISKQTNEYQFENKPHHYKHRHVCLNTETAEKVYPSNIYPLKIRLLIIRLISKTSTTQFRLIYVKLHLKTTQLAS